MFEPVERFLEVFYCPVIVVVARRVLHVNIFIFAKLPIEVSPVEVECIDIPVLARGEREDGPKRCEFGYRGICFEVIGAIDLRKTLRDETRLVFVDGAVCLALDSKYPLAANDVAASVASTRFGPFLELRYIWPITCEIKIRLLRVGRGPLAF